MTIEALMKVHSGKVKGVLIETSPVARMSTRPEYLIMPMMPA